MLLYSYKNQFPQPLPERVRLDSGETRTSLFELNEQQLKNIGFTGPHKVPTFDSNTQKAVWNGSEFEILELTEEEIEIKKLFSGIN